MMHRSLDDIRSEMALPANVKKKFPFRMQKIFWRQYIMLVTASHRNETVHTSGPIRLWICLEYQEAISPEANSRATQLKCITAELGQEVKRPV